MGNSSNWRNIVSTDTVEIATSYKGMRRNVSLEVGKKYLVEPLNNSNKKGSGRIAQLLGFDDYSHPQHSIVRYLDTNRIGRVSVIDLVPYES